MAKVKSYNFEPSNTRIKFIPMKMLFKNTLLTLFLSLATLTHLEAQTFVRLYDCGVPSYFWDVTELNNGDYLCTGFGTVVSSPTGQQVRVLSIQDTNLASQQAYYEVITTSDGGAAFAGLWPVHFGVMRLDAQGDTVWSKWIDPLPNGYTAGTGKSIVQTPDGGFVVAGEIEKSNPYETKAYMVKLDAQGNFLWEYQYGSVRYVVAQSVINTSDGNILIVGYDRNDAVGITTPFVIKLNQSGAVQWTKTYAHALIASPSVNAIEIPSGNFLISTVEKDSSGPVPVYSNILLTINPQGDSLSTKVFANPYRFLEMDATHDGGYIFTGLWIHDSIPDELVLVKVDAQLQEEWTRIYTHPYSNMGARGTAVKQASDGGFLVCGNWGEYALLMKTDSLGNVVNTTVKGKVISDANNNCREDAGDYYLLGHMVQVIADVPYYGYTNTAGEYSIQVFDTGQVTVNWISQDYWVSPTCQPNGFTTSLSNSDTLLYDIFAEPLISCPKLTVAIHTPFLRRCFQNTYVVNYCNNGTLPANGAYLEIEIDPYLIVDSASIPWTSNIGHLYRFNLDTLSIGECGSFNIYVTVDCDSTELGQTHCVSAHIYPDSICLPPNPDWDGSSIKVSGRCDTGDTLNFTIENVGAGDMATPSFFLIAEDNVMYMNGNFQLNSGETFTRRFHGNGSTFTLMADQSEGHLGQSFPLISVEGCGLNGQGTFSKGFVTQFPQNDRDGFVDILCLENVGSYDPNDKRPEPLGLENEGYISATQPLDYTIRFQNTGTDTAFTVVIRDTLSAALDISTLQINGASHPNTFQIVGSNVLEWTFANILLPDSNVNKPLSHGFVSFSIGQTENNAPGTEITNRAGIYFDFNAPIITNTTLNTVFEDYKTWFTFIQSPESKLQLSIFPNPNSGTFSLQFEPKGHAHYEFVVYDLAGARRFAQPLIGTGPYVLQPELATGMYLYRLLEDGRNINTGKVIVNQ